MKRLYINRELSWLKFDERVLEEAFVQEMPLLERLRFLSIYASNLDEFYMVRVGSLHDQSLVPSPDPDTKTGMLPQQQICEVNRTVMALGLRRDEAWENVCGGLALQRCACLPVRGLEADASRAVRLYFETGLLPLLSPQVVDAKHPFPRLENLRLYIGVRLEGKNRPLFGILPAPEGAKKLFFLPGGEKFVLLEDILLRHVELAFPGYEVKGRAVFRVTRNADLALSESLFDEDMDYRLFMEEVLRRRSRLAPVRLETDAGADRPLTEFLLKRLGLKEEQWFRYASPVDMGFADALTDALPQARREELLYVPYRPQWPAGLRHHGIMAQIREHDLMLCYPYESMRPLIELLREASEDKDVVSIKMTLYRVGRQSQIVQMLCAAAENGKQVTAVVELRARFDEQNNINWSAILEESGCQVIYGIDDFKVHGKVLLITRKLPHGRGQLTITNISTGNYNEATARLYSDLALFTRDPVIGADAAELFRNLSIGNVYGRYSRLLVSPVSLKNTFLSLIDGEIRKATAGGHGCVVAKMNSLTDKQLIDRLIEASRAGVTVRLIIRGICCLRPGVPGVTDHIEVRSIVGRFLEHARIYCFGEGADARVYIASADWMTRNTEHRIEVAVPVEDAGLAARLRAMMETELRDNVKARLLGPDGIYLRLPQAGERLDSQLYFCAEAERAAHSEEERCGRNSPAGWGAKVLRKFFPLFQKRGR